MSRFLLLILLFTSPILRAGDLELLVSQPQLGELLDRLKANRHPHFAVVDYGRASTLPRFYLFDSRSHALLSRFRVAHGKGSDPDHDGYADSFSNDFGSRSSSLGLFRTSQVFDSDEPGHGRSMRLIGLSTSNSNAEERAIVIHANAYMEDDFIREHGVPGRSYGCLVLARADRDRVIAQLSGGALIFAISQKFPSVAKE
ncbi:murein L,D-transpeptidase catalytic domain family protein [Metapseudomonas lalkuanensis]|uniref:murein L,D-transpeptidase catalytic domain-containing protein n=1 Tax=Metapseudomonas lalkuanensis TaxID=2604832 RepID=UPI001CF4BA6E|nr:murein L,D-transpeptidase catalytic domain family protein [Pseudomonas lalkuanensis]UCP00539.1 murein L,D-transpeptidase catalytic domain family protein [Pseudomonas lalkuanensis]